jgi:DNA-binding CsgD family transcriptional regulator
VDVSSAELARGRDAYSRYAWKEAYEELSQADGSTPLGGEDLELLAVAAHMLGQDAEAMQLYERAHQAHRDAGDMRPAIRCAIWLGINLALRGDVGPATGWLGRAQRMLDRDGIDGPERGYLLLPVMFQHEAVGDYEGAAATAAEAAAIGERFGDADLVALAVHAQGSVLIKDGRVREGLGLLDEAMIAVTAGKLSPVITGTVYCSVILMCEEVYDVRRAQEWTAALAEWCDRQPDLMAFTGRCLVHRAGLMQLHGAWPSAVEEARRAAQRFEHAMNQAAAAKGHYVEGEVHRLRGEFGLAEQAYRESSRFGWEPQPGLALLRLAQGQPEAAAAAMRRVMVETTDPLPRASLLPAFVEVMLALDELDEAQTASAELADIAARFESDMLSAMQAHVEGLVKLAGGDPAAALVPLRRAWQQWLDLEAPYEAARVRVDIGRACRGLDDEEGCELELEAARVAFEQLGAVPDVAAVQSLTDSADALTHDLTRRELEVLRLVATGKSNRQIAAELSISEHTVARHVQNIFSKLDVSSRTAAGAFAFEHDLV